MGIDNDTTCFQRFWPWWRRLLTGLSLLGLVLSVYLSWHYLEGATMIGCGGGSSCDQVLSSRWSTIAGVLPVSALAAGVYLALLVASLFIGPTTEMSVRRLAWRAMLVFVWAAAGSAVWFIVLQKWVIGAFCPYCMTAHITGLLLATLVTWQSSKQFDDGSTGISKHSAPNSTMDEVIPVTVQDGSPTDSQRAISPLQGIGLALVGLTMTGILAVCQVVITPPLVYQGGETRDTQSAINAYGVPLIGSPDAQYVVTLLFDYTCPHCQQMHFMLNEIVRRYGGTLAFALSPTPLNRQCNPYVLQDVDEFKDACELAKISLAVWVANHALFPDFENWMFSFESGDRWRPRSLDDARAKAVELIGQEKYDDARMNPWIEQYLQTSVQIYGNTIQTGKSAIPKLVFGSRWVVPQPYDAEDLVPILRDSLGIPVDSFGP